MKTRNSAQLVIGLTGGVGTGKTTAARMFNKAGAEVIDADCIAHELLRRKGGAYREIVAVFGPAIVLRNGMIDRRTLGKKVFKDLQLRIKLERILHPRIIRRIKETARRSSRKVVIIDAPLLYETGLEKYVDKVVVVTATPAVQRRRYRLKTGRSCADLRARIAAQLPLKRKVRLADFVIDNNGTRMQMKEQVEVIRRSLWRS